MGEGRLHNGVAWVVREHLLQPLKLALRLVGLAGLEQQQALVDGDLQVLLLRELVLQGLLGGGVDALQGVEEVLALGAQRDDVVARDGEHGDVHLALLARLLLEHPGVHVVGRVQLALPLENAPLLHVDRCHLLVVLQAAVLLLLLLLVLLNTQNFLDLAVLPLALVLRAPLLDALAELPANTRAGVEVPAADPEEVQAVLMLPEVRPHPAEPRAHGVDLVHEGLL
mmetsp:Transcript_86368/g.186699  ORF Transcript_86368/g.186699 Transcript_86368/m.186699 type:complete len:226 (+) Transcript_86368:988-1665(+)